MGTETHSEEFVQGDSDHNFTPSNGRALEALIQSAASQKQPSGREIPSLFPAGATTIDEHGERALGANPAGQLLVAALPQSAKL